MNFYAPFPEDERPHKATTLLDKKILEMIQKAALDEAASARYFNMLSDALIAGGDKQLARSIALDDIKHGKYYGEIYRVLSGAPGPVPPAQTDSSTPRGTLPSVFSEKIAEKLNGIAFCRQIYLALFNLEYRDMLFEILTDEQTHAQVMTFLYAKYSRV